MHSMNQANYDQAKRNWEGEVEGGRERDELTVSPGLTVFSPSLPPVMPSPRVGSLVSDTSI